MAVIVDIDGRGTQTEAGVSLFELAARLGVRVPTSCRALGRCKECLVEVTSGADLLSPPTAVERHLAHPFRLSCQARVTGIGTSTGTHVTCHTMRRGRLRIERRATGLPTTGRLCAREPAVTRDGLSVRLDGEEIDRRTGPLHGLAMDVGTTTVVLRLVDLETGDTVADTAFENPQRFGGSDVMARIHYDAEHRGKPLMRTLARYVRHAIEELPVDPSTIYEAVVVGNSTMRDLFFRKPVHSIGQHPYQSITELQRDAGDCASTGLIETPRRLLLPIHPRGRVYGLPIISGHVGADAAACLLAVDLATEDRLVAVLDIGTNTELLLGTRHRIVAASCPAGPAFEGGAITCGMPALDGAVDDVALDEEGGLTLSVVGGGAPQGICGSGLVALLGELLRTGRMDVMGRFAGGADRITLDPTGRVRLLERDVSELAKAKGATVAGLQVACSTLGVAPDDIELLYLAGGFGRTLDLDASRRIGLIPPLPDSRIIRVGNAAIEGAAMALVSMARRRELESLVARVEHCRLESHPRFFDLFVEGCLFKPVDPGDAGAS